MAKAKSYIGFGEAHGLREWARLLDVNKDTLRYWLTTKKLTIEDFAKQNGIVYSAPDDTGRYRVNRKAQAEVLIYQLFERSGYDPEKVTNETTPGSRIHKIYYESDWVGDYNIDTGALKFSDGVEGINLINFPVPQPKIFLHPEGWGVHPQTRAAIVDRILKH